MTSRSSQMNSLRHGTVWGITALVCLGMLTRPNIIFARSPHKIIAQQNWQEGARPLPLARADAGFAYLSLISAGINSPPAGEIQLSIDRQQKWTIGGDTSRFFRVQATVVSGPRDDFEAQPQIKSWGKGQSAVKLIHKNDGFAVLSGVGGVFKDRHEAIWVRLKPDGYWYLEGHSRAVGTRAYATIFVAKKPGSFNADVQEFAHDTNASRIKMIHSREGFCFLSGMAGNFNGGGRRKWIELGDDGFWYLHGVTRGGKGVHQAWATSVKFNRMSNDVATVRPAEAKIASNSPVKFAEDMPAGRASSTEDSGIVGSPRKDSPPTDSSAVPPKNGDMIAEVEFDEPYDDFRFGGGGRYIVFYHKSARRLRVFDVSTAELIGETTISASDALFAAGMEDVMVALPTQELVIRYRLPDLERVAVKPLGSPGFRMSKVIMGYASSGPLLIWSKAEGILWDVETMEPMPVETFDGHPKWGLHITVSGDGQTFLGWVDTGSGGTLNMMRIAAGKTQLQRGFGGINGPSQIQPDRHAGSIYCQNGRVLDSAMTKLPMNSRLANVPLFPTEDPRFFYGCHGWGDSCQVSICTAADQQVVYTLSGLPEFSQRHEWNTSNPRVRYCPSFRRIAVLPVTNDRIVLRRLDVVEEFQRQDRVTVYSKPPASAERGELYDYQVEAVSQAGNIQYALESAPPDMKIDQAGRLTWRCPKAQTSASVPVVISVRDAAGHEAFHSFTISVPPRIIAKVHNPTVAMPSATKPSANGTKATEKPPVEVEDTAIHRVAGPRPILSYGRGGATILMLDKTQLRILGKNGEKVLRAHEFPVEYRAIYERPKYFVALAAKSVDLIDKQSWAVNKSIPIEYSKVRQLAIHPHRPVSYVSVENPTVEDYVRSKPVLEVHELTGDVRELREVFGSWLAMDPAGRRLYTGLREMFKDGLQILNGRISDRFDTIDYVTAYDLASDPPVMLGRNENPGKNGKRFRISPDGRHVSYVAGGGAPGYGYSIASLSADDVQRETTRYVVEAYPNDISHHPMANLVACCNGVSSDQQVWIYNRPTGEKLTDRLRTSRRFKGLDGVFFAPSGTHLLVTHNLSGVVVESIPLNLTAEDRRAIAEGFPAGKATEESSGSVTRIWTDDTGKFTVEAALLSVEGNNITLQREGGRTVSLPISRLSDADQEYIRRVHAAHAKKTRPTSLPEKPGVDQAVSALRRDLEDELKFDDGQITALEIDVTDRKITDSHLRYLSVLPELRYLELGDCANITDDGLRWLRECQGLREIYLNNARQVTDAGVAHLGGLKELAELTILCPNLTDKSLEHIKNLANLKELSITESRGITDAGLTHLKEMKQLEFLDLWESSVTGSGFVHLRNLTNLKSLVLVYTQVNDASLMHLEGLKKLRHLNVKQSKVTPEGAKRLQQVLPECEVLFTQ